MKAVLFDLDFTLFNTDKYYLEAFLDISKYLESKYGLASDKVCKTLVEMSSQRKDKYSHLFDDLISHYNLKDEKIEDMVKVFNRHKVDSSYLYPDALPTLANLRSKKYKLAIITDGNLERQTHKIENLGLEKLVDTITYTQNSEPKPSPAPFMVALKAIDVEPSSAICVGDNPMLDFAGPKKIGIKTVRILRGRYTHIPHDDVDYTIENLDELQDILAKI
ncbi:MAG TPA: HAD family hydrolase [Candidatus Limnocylindrales bacterium]|nr:HAD family hydrolase [Candidatus Limnocylindrales bacterium]